MVQVLIEGQGVPESTLHTCALPGRKITARSLSGQLAVLAEDSYAGALVRCECGLLWHAELIGFDTWWMNVSRRRARALMRQAGLSPSVL